MVKTKNVLKTLTLVGTLALSTLGVQYFLRHNRMDVDENVIRSRQPSQSFIKKLHKDEGLDSILSLRGKTGTKPYKDYAINNGITLYELGISKNAFPPKETLAKIIDVVQDPKNHPLLIHCQAGVDRSAFAATVYELTKGKSVEEAKEQMNIWHGHIGHCALDTIIDTYKTEGENKGINFETWVDKYYTSDKFK